MKVLQVALAIGLWASSSLGVSAVNMTSSPSQGDSALPIPPDGIVDDAMPGWTWSSEKETADPSLHGGSAHALPSGAVCSYTFNGTGVDVFTTQLPAAVVDGRSHKVGMLRISIDGALQSQISQYATSTTYDYKAFGITGLPAHNHVIQVEATGGWGVIDYLKIHTSETDSVKMADVPRAIFSTAPTITWSNYIWNVNRRRGIGSGIVRGGLNNVYTDTDGCLHLNINNRDGYWTGAELGTSAEFGYGSFYWVVSGPLSTFEPQDVLAGFTYGPDHGIGADGTNEIALEFSRWNSPNRPANGDFDIFPSPGTPKGANSSQFWKWDNNGDVATCRIDWTPTSVTESIWSGAVPPTAPTSTAVTSRAYLGPMRTIPQNACPFFFNLRAFQVPPSREVEFVVKDFKYTPANSTL